MGIYRQADLKPSLFDRPVVTLGNFDGVHCGHRQILKKTIDDASSRGVRSVVLTFEPHPVKVLNPSANLLLIHPYEEKNRYILKQGIDDLVIWTFDKGLAGTPAKQFVKDVLVGILGAQKIIVGYDFNFGKGGDGNAAALQEIARESGYDYEVEQVGVYQLDGEVVHSSRIRQHLMAGDVARVGKLLGRCFHLKGSVVRGKGRGRGLGFPTANLSVQQELIPKQGVYLGQVCLNGDPLDALVNVGDNPTFGVNPITVEAFILNFQGELYESAIEVRFLERLRDEMRFADGDALKLQIKQDFDQALKYFETLHKKDNG